eukprot:TRINITY_DN186_c0_g3_i2.p1 TRINITY_DN186_c0_g3~~TRINITY_DN186_c0_g3_i2.p1  ORF type:complete len:219 (-),score=53.76 TRINITY_DN186_c0_g3_i2:981-1637(-)
MIRALMKHPENKKCINCNIVPSWLAAPARKHAKPILVVCAILLLLALFLAFPGLFGFADDNKPPDPALVWKSKSGQADEGEAGGGGNADEARSGPASEEDASAEGGGGKNGKDGAASFTVEESPGVNFPDHDLTGGHFAAMKDVKACQRLCFETPECNAYSFGLQETKWPGCWLKSEPGEVAYPTEGFSSGIITRGGVVADPYVLNSQDAEKLEPLAR